MIVVLFVEQTLEPQRDIPSIFYTCSLVQCQLLKENFVQNGKSALLNSCMVEIPELQLHLLFIWHFCKQSVRYIKIEEISSVTRSSTRKKSWLQISTLRCHRRSTYITAAISWNTMQVFDVIKKLHSGFSLLVVTRREMLRSRLSSLF